MGLQVEYLGREALFEARVYTFRVLTWPQGERVRKAVFNTDAGDFAGWVRARQDDKVARKDAEAELDRAIVEHAVAYLQAFGGSLADSTELLVVEVQCADFDKRANTRKACRYQERRAGDLYCLVAHKHPKNTAATSQNACETKCGVPDSRVSCSHLMHVSVVIGKGRAPEPNAVSAVCDIGNNEPVKELRNCVPTGHKCWRRVVDQGRSTTRSRLPPLALSEAFDHLAATWDGKFQDPPFLVIRHVTSAAELELGCSSRDEFSSRLSAVGDVMKAFKINDSRLSKTTNQDHTLTRLDDALGMMNGGKNPASTAIAELRAVTKLRNTFQHPAQLAAEQATHATALGIAWPPTTWVDAWQQVRVRVVEALREIRKAIP